MSINGLLAEAESCIALTLPNLESSASWLNVSYVAVFKSNANAWLKDRPPPTSGIPVISIDKPVVVLLSLTTSCSKEKT